MFPAVQENSTEEVEKETAMGKSFLFNFLKGDFETVDGKVIKIDGLEAIKVWIEKTLRTEKFRYKIYEISEYGICLSNLVHSGNSLDFIKMEMEREIREALENNPDVQRVHSFSFERVKSGMLSTFTVDTKYGQTGGEVRL